MGSGPFLIHTLTNDVIPFDGASVFTIGRSGDCSLDIAAIYISRKQCRIENLENVGWVLYDESRYKTTKLNNESISSNFAVLKDGDKISFVPNSGAHEYRFHCERNESQRKKRKLDDVMTQISDEISNNPNNGTVENDRCITDLWREMATQSSLSLLSPNMRSRCEELETIKKENMELELKLKKTEQDIVSHDLFVCLLKTENTDLVSRIEELEKSNQQLNERLNTQAQNKAYSEEQTLKQQLLEQQLLQLKSSLDVINQENSELKGSVEDAEYEIENLLKERCCKIIKFGADSKNHHNISMDTLTEVELSLMKEDVKELTKKNSELSVNLEKVTSEKEDFSNKVNEIIDSELYCSICSDLIYQAITLQCKHTYCKMCIEEWKKKKRDCPVCRTKIRTQVPCLIIDSFIDKVADTLGGEVKARRQELIKERKEAAAAGSATRTNRRKRTAALPNIPPFPPLDPILEHLDVGFGGPDLFNDIMVHPLIFPPPHFPEVVDLTNGSPPHPPFRGFERLRRRRSRR